MQINVEYNNYLLNEILMPNVKEIRKIFAVYDNIKFSISFNKELDYCIIHILSSKPLLLSQPEDECFDYVYTICINEKTYEEAAKKSELIDGLERMSLINKEDKYYNIRKFNRSHIDALNKLILEPFYDHFILKIPEIKWNDKYILGTNFEIEEKDLIIQCFKRGEIFITTPSSYSMCINFSKNESYTFIFLNNIERLTGADYNVIISINDKDNIKIRINDPINFILFKKFIKRYTTWTINENEQ